MAHLPRRSEELPLRRLLLPLLLILSGGPTLLGAQETGGGTPDGEAVRGLLAFSAGLTEVKGEVDALLGMSAMLEVGRSWRAGGAGYGLTRDVTFGEGELGESRLRVGYGGVLVEWTRAATDDTRDTALRLLLLAGAGNAELRVVPLGTRLDSDNFAVLEPGVLLERRLLGRISAGLSARYRLVLAVDDLGGLEERDLDGAVLALQLRLGPF